MAILKIKRSGTTGAPPTLAQAELGYSYLAGTEVNGGDRLYIGTGTETGGAAANIEVIGGKYFTSKLDHTPGTLTANSAIITDTNNKIDQILVDNLSLDGNTLASTNLNGNIILDPNGTGTIQLNGPVVFSDSVDFSGNTTFEAISSNTVSTNTLDVTDNAIIASLAVSDLTAGRVVLAGTSGELQDNGNLTFNGSLLTVSGSASITTSLTAASAAISDLTSGRVVLAGASGELQDSGNLTFNGTALTVTGNANITSSLTAGSAAVSDLTTNRIVVVGISGELQDFSTLTYTASQFTVGSNTNITGSLDVTGDLSVDNIGIDSNDIFATNVDGNINLIPNGSGFVDVNNSRVTGISDPVANTDAVTLGYLEGTYTSTLSYTADSGSDTIDLRTQTLDIAGNTGITTTVTNNQIDIDLDDTAVTPGSYGSTTQIPVVTVDQQGRVTAASEVFIAAAPTNLNITGDTGSDGVDLIAETLNFQGGTAVTTTVSNNNVEIALTQDISTTANVVFRDIEATGDLVVAGDFTVNGNTSFVNVQNLEIEDALIRLASNNNSDVVDIGFVGSYNDGVADQYAGIFRDATNSEFYVFEAYEDIDLLDNIVDRSSNTFSLGIFNADIYRFTESTLELTGDVAGTVNFSSLGGNTISVTTTIQPNSISLGTDTTGSYVQSVGVTPSTGLSISGSGESATVTIAGVNADAAGTKGVSTYDATNFDVTAGLVSIDTVDGGTY